MRHGGGGSKPSVQHTTLKNWRGFWRDFGLKGATVLALALFYYHKITV
jgi:hypothetical protein